MIIKQRLSFIVVILGLFLLTFHSSAEAGLISVQDEIAMGQEGGAALEKEFGLVDNPQLQERVNRIGRKVAAASGRNDLEFSFKVLNTSEINAVSLPGGKVYLFQGVVDYMQTDEELAGVMAHEVAHIAKRHSIKQMEKNMGMTLLMLAAFGGKGVELQQIILNAIIASYSREDEREADLLGCSYIIKSGGNPYSSLLGMMKLKALENKQTPNYGLFSDHPETEERIKLMQEDLSKRKIHPFVVVKNDMPKVVDADWELPGLAVNDGNIVPLVRTYIAAGALWTTTQSPNFDSGKYILYAEDGKIYIMYDEQIVITLTQDDAVFYNTSLEELAATYLEKVKNWAELTVVKKNL